MESKISYYKYSEGIGWIENPNDNTKDIYFHISDVIDELLVLLEAKRFKDEPIVFDVKDSDKKVGTMVAYNIRLDLTKRSVGYVKTFEGYGWITDFHSKQDYFIHFSKLRGSSSKHITLEKNEPVVFTKSSNDNGLEALDVVKIDNRCELESFAEFDDFKNSLEKLKAFAELEHWDYVKNPTSQIPVLFSYINHTFHRIQNQDKLVLGKSSKDKKEYAYFNTGLVTPFQDEIYGYFEKVSLIPQTNRWQMIQPEYEFIEFNTDQSHYRKYFPGAPQMATYFAEAEVRELIYDASLNNGEIIIDRDHIKGRRDRFPTTVASFDDDLFFDSLKKSVELAIRRVKRNYKTAIPFFYSERIQFLLPLCMQNKKDADLALVVKKEESVYKADTVLSLDQAYNNARLLAKPDREWLNP